MAVLPLKDDEEERVDWMLDLVPMGLAMGIIVTLFVIAEAIITRWP